MFKKEGNRVFIDKDNIAQGSYGIVSWDVDTYYGTAQADAKAVAAFEPDHNGTKGDLLTTSGNVTLKVPKLRNATFETAIIERYKRRESSVEEALIESIWPVFRFVV